MRTGQIVRLLVIAAFIAAASPAGHAATSTYNVSVNTSALIGHPAGPFYLCFALTDGSGLSEGNNTVTVGNFNFSSGSATGNPASLGGVSGDLGSTVSLVDTSALNFFSEAFSAGQSLSFTFTASNNLDDGPVPDGFAFYILDNLGRPVPTLSSGSDYFVGLALGVNGATPLVFGSDTSRSPSTGNPILIPTVSAVPPSPIITFGGAVVQAPTNDGQGHFVSQVTITNAGNVTVDSAQIVATGTTLGTATLSSLPAVIANLTPGASAMVTLTFPITTALSTATSAPLKINGTYSTGTLSGNWSVTFRSVTLSH